MRYFAWLFASVIFAVAPSPQAKEVLFLTLEYPPYASEQMEHQGAAVELLELMLDGCDFQPKVQFIPWSRVLHELKLGRADGVLLLWPEELKRHNALASSALFLSRLGFYVRRPELGQRDLQLSALRNQRICTVHSYGYPPELAKAGVIFDEAQDDLANLRRMQLGRCDYVALERAVGEFLLAHDRTGLADAVAWAEPAFAELPLKFAVTADKADSAALMEAIEQGLQRLKLDGRYQQLLQRYGLDAP